MERVQGYNVKVSPLVMICAYNCFFIFIKLHPTSPYKFRVNKQGGHTGVLFHERFLLQILHESLINLTGELYQQNY